MFLGAFSQKDGYGKSYVADGYDVVSYFSNKATKGSSDFSATYEGKNYLFVSKENKEKFLKNPSHYVPQYDGWCAYAMAINGKKVSINPETYEIRDNKLYLFYNYRGTNTLKKWLKEKPNELVNKADENWEKG